MRVIARLTGRASIENRLYRVLYDKLGLIRKSRAAYINVARIRAVSQKYPG